jgi:hypothetical protein
MFFHVTSVLATLKQRMAKRGAVGLERGADAADGRKTGKPDRKSGETGKRR